MKVALSLSAIALLIGTTACSAPQSAPEDTSQSLGQGDSALAQTQALASSQERPEFNRKAVAAIMVNGKVIKVELDGTHAPVTVGNFIDLAERGVYDGTSFHRVVKDPKPFVAQGGDPQSKNPNIPESNLGSGNFKDPETKQDRFIPLEIKPVGEDKPIYSKTFKSAGIAKAPQLSHRKGAIAMARTPFPDSASAQFYFALTNLDFLDGDYAVFGYVTEGMDVVESIQQGDVIESVKIIEGLEQADS